MPLGTIRITTRDRHNDAVLWDGVWCADCVATHKKIFDGDDAVVVTERPWTGAPRPCDSCDDSDNAPEFKFSEAK